MTAPAGALPLHPDGGPDLGCSKPAEKVWQPTLPLVYVLSVVQLTHTKMCEEKNDQHAQKKKIGFLLALAILLTPRSH